MIYPQDSVELVLEAVVLLLRYLYGLLNFLRLMRTRTPNNRLLLFVLFNRLFPLKGNNDLNVCSATLLCFLMVYISLSNFYFRYIYKGSTRVEEYFSQFSGTLISNQFCIIWHMKRKRSFSFIIFMMMLGWFGLCVPCFLHKLWM